MSRAKIAVGAFAALLALLGLAAGYRVFQRFSQRDAGPAAPPEGPPPASSKIPPAAAAYQGFLYGRVTTVEGGTYEGRLRWGSDQEAFWDDYFNGPKHGNAWLAQVPSGQHPVERHTFSILGFQILQRKAPAKLDRIFMVPFGEIARIEARGRDVRVLLKNGNVADLDRLGASDIDDGLRIWDARRGTVFLDSLRIRAVELLSTAPLAATPGRLQGTVHTRQGDFTGFIQWNRDDCMGTDELSGETAGKALKLRFDTLRSIIRSGDGVRVTLLDGREIDLSGTPDVGHDNLGIYVDDPRYGRVKISWDTFERADFRSGDSGPAYGDFPPGRPLTGSVTTRAGRRLAGRLVYDLDESETPDTLDAPSKGVDYIIPFGRIASIAPPGRVTLRSGETLDLESAGDLGQANAGLLIFTEGGKSPEYVPWTDVERIDLDPATSSPGPFS
jgi:hypothetical protein